MALFNSCRIYDNVKMVKHIVNFFWIAWKCCQEYMSLSNHYVVIYYKHLCENVEYEIKEKKQLGCCSWIEMSNDMHAFAVED